MDITIAAAAEELKKAQDILLLAHKSPDGDTLGSCFSLCYALTSLGKRVRVACSDPIPPKYDYLLREYHPAEFSPGYIAAVDVADTKLLGPGTQEYGERADLCIDHHQTNTDYARLRCLDYTQAATAQICYALIQQLGVEITPVIADCLFTGISTDTGCFRYTNVTPLTHRIAAELMECGAMAGEINRIMFDQKSKSRLAVERMVMETLEYAYEGRCALICVSKDILQQTGASPDELEGVSSMPRQIEGVWAGITLNERDGGYKVSMRTDAHIDASKVCALLGGGGHKQAAGCFIEADFVTARQRLLDALKGFMA